ncbi:MAG: tetratricopeptide repeat protein [Leptolyngbyaceae cyanobacterium SU_3_3]|nr:tetratricopeptide repeat protein [Leptolyngbyaceae cyanobacterium SU_3_3]
MSAIDPLKRWYRRSAVAIAEMVVTAKPEAGNYDRLAQALVQTQQWDAAIAACQQAIQLDPKQPWFYKTLSEAYIGVGHWEAAIAACRTGIGFSPDLSWLHHGLAKALMGEEKWDAAIAACQRAIELEESVSWFHFTLGEVFFKSGQWEGAIVPFRRAIELAPNFAWSYYYLGQALVAQEEVEAAIAVYQQGLRRQPTMAYLRSCLDYTLHLSDQDQRIQAYCLQAQADTQKRGDRPLRILMLTPYPTYPPKHGAITRMFYEMKALGSQHHLAIVSFVFIQSDYQLEKEIGHYCDLSITVMLGDCTTSPASGAKVNSSLQ